MHLGCLITPSHTKGVACFAQDGTGDLLLSADKRFMLVTNPIQCAAQNLTNRFLLFRGEWFLDTRVGLPYYQVIAVKNPDLKVLRQMFTQVILSTPPIVAIDLLDITITPNRQGMLNLRARTEGGTITTGGDNQFIVEFNEAA